jgi:hypothetical protein
MKKATSNHAALDTEGQLRTATTKALAAEKAAHAEKEKARLAKRRYKDARKAFKQAKKSAKKALKHARQAQADLKACVDTVAKEKKRTAMLAKRAAAQETAATARTAMGGPKSRSSLQNRKELSPSLSANPTSDQPQPAMDASGFVGATPVGGLNV